MNQTKKVFSDLILNHLKDGVYFGKKVFRDEGIQRPTANWPKPDIF